MRGLCGKMIHWFWNGRHPSIKEFKLISVNLKMTTIESYLSDAISMADLSSCSQFVTDIMNAFEGMESYIGQVLSMPVSQWISNLPDTGLVRFHFRGEVTAPVSINLEHQWIAYFQGESVDVYQSWAGLKACQRFSWTRTDFITLLTKMIESHELNALDMITSGYVRHMLSLVLMETQVQHVLNLTNDDINPYLHRREIVDALTNGKLNDFIYWLWIKPSYKQSDWITNYQQSAKLFKSLFPKCYQQHLQNLPILDGEYVDFQPLAYEVSRCLLLTLAESEPELNRFLVSETPPSVPDLTWTARELNVRSKPFTRPIRLHNFDSELQEAWKNEFYEIGKKAESTELFKSRLVSILDQFSSVRDQLGWTFPSRSNETTAKWLWSITRELRPSESLDELSDVLYFISTSNSDQVKARLYPYWVNDVNQAIIQRNLDRLAELAYVGRQFRIPSMFFEYMYAIYSHHERLCSDSSHWMCEMLKSPIYSRLNVPDIPLEYHPIVQGGLTEITINYFLQSDVFYRTINAGGCYQYSPGLYLYEDEKQEFYYTDAEKQTEVLNVVLSQTCNIIFVNLHIAKQFSSHENVLIFDRELRTIYHFEPHDIFMNRLEEQELVNHSIENLLNELTKLSSSSWTLIYPQVLCPATFGVQTYEPGLKGAGGFCALYSLYLIHLKILNPDQPVETLVDYLNTNRGILSELQRYKCYVLSVVEDYMGNLGEGYERDYREFFNDYQPFFQCHHK